MCRTNPLVTLDFDCPHCGAKKGGWTGKDRNTRIPGEWCKTPRGGESKHTHVARIKLFNAAKRKCDC